MSRLVQEIEDQRIYGDFDSGKAIDSLENEVDRLEYALRRIDANIRSTPDPVPYIVETLKRTLKRTLPEYEEEYNG